MASYYVNEAVFEVPFDTFRDRSVTLLEAKLDGGGDLTVGIQRGEYAPGHGLERFVDDHIEKAGRTLRAYQLVARVEREVAGLRAVEVTCRWRNGKDLVHTRQAFVDLGKAWWLISTNGKVADRDAVDAANERVLSTLRFRE